LLFSIYILIGNYLFPRWELIVPLLGMFCSQAGNNLPAT
jgi:hypothetical protein